MLKFLIFEMLFLSFDPYFQNKTCSKFHENIHGVSAAIGRSSEKIPAACIEIQVAKLLKQFYYQAKKNGFFTFWAPRFWPIFTIFLLNNECSSLDVHINFHGSRLSLSRVSGVKMVKNSIFGQFFQVRFYTDHCAKKPLAYSNSASCCAHFEMLCYRGSKIFFFGP